MIRSAVGESFCKDGEIAAGVEGAGGVPWFEAPFVMTSRFWVPVRGDGAAEVSSTTAVAAPPAFFFFFWEDLLAETGGGGGAPGTIR